MQKDSFISREYYVIKSILKDSKPPQREVYEIWKIITYIYVEKSQRVFVSFVLYNFVQNNFRLPYCENVG